MDAGQDRGVVGQLCPEHAADLSDIAVGELTDPPIQVGCVARRLRRGLGVGGGHTPSSEPSPGRMCPQVAGASCSARQPVVAAEPELRDIERGFDIALRRQTVIFQHRA